MTINSDEKYLRTMVSIIDSYKLGNISLGRLINDLDGLINLLNTTELKYVYELQRLWGSIDDVYADMLYDKETVLSEESRQIIENKLNKLKTLLNDILHSS